MRQVLIIFSIIISLVSCSKEKEMTTDFWGKGIGIVAERSIIDGDTIILCDYNKVKKYTLKEIPYSLIASNYSLVKLDNSNEKAFLSAQITPIAISQNYIAVYSYDYSPLKLFSRKDGKYIRDIGSRGQGPGEYDMVLYAQIDEDSNSIYLLSSQSNVILVYDINGTYLRSSVKEKKIYAATGLGIRHESFLWVIDLNGHVLQKLDSSEKYDLRGARVLIGKANLGVCDLFINYRHVFFQDAMNINTNDIYSNQYDKSNPRNVVDCFCHYDLEGNRLIPKFAIKNLDEDYTIYEFPEYFVVETLISTYGHSEESIKSKKIIVDKKNLKENLESENKCNSCEKLEKELKETKELLLRTAAEYDNFRKRSEKEKDAIYADASALAVKNILPVADSLDLALKSSENQNEEYKKGLKLLKNQLDSAFKNLKVESFGEAGEDFDPNIHNAIAHKESSEEKQNFISLVYQKGYKMGERIIRHAMVEVTN